jgi:hypothetical protein
MGSPFFTSEPSTTVPAGDAAVDGGFNVLLPLFREKATTRPEPGMFCCQGVMVRARARTIVGRRGARARTRLARGT